MEASLSVTPSHSYRKNKHFHTQYNLLVLTIYLIQLVSIQPMSNSSLFVGLFFCVMAWVWSGLLDTLCFPLRLHDLCSSTTFFFYGFLLFYVYQHFALMYVCEPYACLVRLEVQKGYVIPWNWDFKGFLVSVWILGTEPGSFTPVLTSWPSSPVPW